MLPTGEQVALRRGPVTATVATLAACLRSLRVDGTAVVQEYADDRIPPYAAGIVLVPFANRVAGATWTLDGKPQALDVTEPARGNASHGLLRNTGYVVADRADDRVVLAAPVHPQHGWPFLLETQVTYALTDDGLRVTHRLVNHADAPAPVAVGSHPYLRVGDVPVGDLVLTVRAATAYETDERLVPVRQVPVGPGTDLRDGVRLAEVSLDTAYADLELLDGAHRHRLTAPDGTTTELWAEPDFGFVQVFTQPAFPGPGGVELAVAVEPMTAPSDALNSGVGLRWLAPGEEWEPSWGIRLLPA